MIDLIQQNNRIVIPIIFPISYGAMKSINCYLYHDGTKLALIDAGIKTPEYEQFFDKVLQMNNLSIQDIDEIYLTHHHEDHIGLVNRILQQKKVPIFAHHLAIPRLNFDKQYLEQKRDFFLKIYEEYGCLHLAGNRFKKMEQTYKNRDQLKMKAEIHPLYEGDCINNFDVLEVPGHSPDSIVFYSKEEQWQFAGDLILENTSTNALIDFDRNLQLLPTVAQYEKSLLKCKGLKTKWIFPGHQNPFTDYELEIQKKLERIKKKEARIIDAVGNGYRLVVEIAEKLYGNRIEKEFLFIFSEIIGYLDYAVGKGTLEKTMQNGQWYFTKVEKTSDDI